MATTVKEDVNKSAEMVSHKNEDISVETDKNLAGAEKLSKLHGAYALI